MRDVFTMPRPMALDRAVFDQALARTVRRLLDARNDRGHWTGELSSSALSTATSIFALYLHQQSARPAVRHDELISRGVSWLVSNQNADGGWGDTTVSHSNISTTVLCYAAMSAIGGESAAETLQRAEAWIVRAAGSTEPDAIVDAVIARYGDDQTFSVPILTMCALAGLLGEGRRAWRRVPQLPFELAALPQDLFRFLNLPVVSYALPALIAIGQVRHRRAPSGNPAAFALRLATTSRTLQVLRRIQPAGGGFLEASPLTSFVSMSLIGAGRGNHAVIRRGVEFLVRSMRTDGSWPIDTNLATWVTTLSVNALAVCGHDALGPQDRATIARWLIDQQLRQIHPYTGADPGGFAWTDLPGGVPDADDTAGALVALHHLRMADGAAVGSAKPALRWLMELANRDGGMPTFCRGWGRLPFDRSGADLTAHAILAFSRWHDITPPAQAAYLWHSMGRGLNYLRSAQRRDGAWLPLWFGNQHAPHEENPVYGTARVLIGLGGLNGERITSIRPMREAAIRFLLSAQNADGSFGGAAGTPGSIEETAVAVQAMAQNLTNGYARQLRGAVLRGVEHLIERTEGGERFQPSPIGFYFAKLWYYERLYPLIFVAGALNETKRVWDALQ